jgi:hypothetical protein
MNASLKNALMKMMQNKEQDQASKLQFREDLDHMGESMKFAVSSLDQKLSSQIELIEKNMRYAMEGFKREMDARVTKFLKDSNVGETAMAAYTQMVQDEVDSLRRQGEEMQGLMKERLLTVETGLARFKHQIYILN